MRWALFDWNRNRLHFGLDKHGRSTALESHIRDKLRIIVPRLLCCDCHYMMMITTYGFDV